MNQIPALFLCIDVNAVWESRRGEKQLMDSIYNVSVSRAEQFISLYADCLLKKFRIYNKDTFIITIANIGCFLDKDDVNIKSLLSRFDQFDFHVAIEGEEKNVCAIEVFCNNITKNESYSYCYHIQDITSIIDLSNKTEISIGGLIIMKIVAQTIIKLKILYKAIVFDLDDTLWFGTLAEDGKDAIIANLKSDKGKPYIEFMNFVKILAEELGIYIAICSRNDSKIATAFIDEIEENIFPLKNQIDCIIANYNDKSENIKEIAKQLSILPESIVFVDDNQIIRDEVRTKLPSTYVPKWQTLSDLKTQIIAGCIFERNELSVNSQERRIQRRIIETERKKCDFPSLLIKAIDDKNNEESQRLYSKSSQFKFSSQDNNFNEDARSVYFELYQENGNNVGVCSAFTYCLVDNVFLIYNWAISCRYFEIGLEEFVLGYIEQKANECQVLIKYEPTERNNKVKELLNKYSNVFHFNANGESIEIQIDNEVRNNTRIKLI